MHCSPIASSRAAAAAAAAAGVGIGTASQLVFVAIKST
jgi:hypothetical protein